MSDIRTPAEVAALAAAEQRPRVVFMVNPKGSVVPVASGFVAARLAAKYKLATAA